MATRSVPAGSSTSVCQTTDVCTPHTSRSVWIISASAFDPGNTTTQARMGRALSTRDLGPHQRTLFSAAALARRPAGRQKVAPMASPAGASWSVVLDDEHAPPSSTPERREYLSWLFFAVTKLQPAVLEVFMARGNAAATRRARAAFDVHAKEIEKALSSRQVLVG